MSTIAYHLRQEIKHLKKKLGRTKKVENINYPSVYAMHLWLLTTAPKRQARDNYKRKVCF